MEAGPPTHQIQPSSPSHQSVESTKNLSSIVSIPFLKSYTIEGKSISFLETEIKGVCFLRRLSDDWVNMNQILKLAGFSGDLLTSKIKATRKGLVHQIIRGGGNKAWFGTW